MISTAIGGDVPAPGLVRPLVVLVHGAWLDGSSWNDVMSRLQARGIDVLAVRSPLHSLAGDVAVVQRVVAEQTQPVILVGHGWGGTVITQATVNDKVAALVYVSGFAPDRGESTRSLKAWEPMPGQRRLLHADTAGYLHFQPAHFPHHLAHDLPLVHARVLAALDAPIHGDALDEVVNAAAWRSVPSWYAVATQDRMIPATLQRRMASRMGAIVQEITASHAVMLSRPREVTQVICDAVSHTH